MSISLFGSEEEKKNIENISSKRLKPDNNTIPANIYINEDYAQILLKLRNDYFTPELLDYVKRNFELFEEFHGKKILENINSILPDYINTYETIKKLSQDKALKLASSGWFCDIGTTKTEYNTFMENVFFACNSENIDEEFSKYFSKNTTMIEKRLIYFYPERAEIITEAFSNHKHGRYYSSIPLFLILADGFTYIKIDDACLYSSRNKKPKISEAPFVRFLQQENLINQTVMAAVNNFTAFNTPEHLENSNNFDPDKHIINRHRILHGKEINYGNENNSLKAISLLNFFACLFNSWHEILK